MPIIALLTANVVGGILFFRLNYDLNLKLKDHIRASILSLASFVTKLVMSGYLVLYGYLTGNLSFTAAMLVTAIILAAVFTVYNPINNKFTE